MNLLDKLERKFGKYAISNLILYIMIGTVTTNLFQLVFFREEMFSFYIEAILSGQFWRIVTFVFAEYYPASRIIWLFIFVLCYYFIGSSLEQLWGTFKFNLYYFSGVLSTMAACIIAHLLGYTVIGTPHFINLSLFLAFATLFPEEKFIIYFIIPVKAKYLAIIYGLVLFKNFMAPGISNKVLILVSLLNYFIFVGVPYLKQRPTKAQRSFRKSNRKLTGSKSIKVAFHKCTVCGKTELDDPNMEFRYCISCNGNYEYCMDHLKNHTHKQ